MKMADLNEKNGNITLTQRQLWYGLITLFIAVFPPALTLYNQVSFLRDKVTDMEKKMEKIETYDQEFKKEFLMNFNEFEKKQIEEMTKIKTELLFRK